MKSVPIKLEYMSDASCSASYNLVELCFIAWKKTDATTAATKLPWRTVKNAQDDKT